MDLMSAVRKARIEVGVFGITDETAAKLINAYLKQPETSEAHNIVIGQANLNAAGLDAIKPPVY